MYEVDPEWNRRISGGELLDNMIAGSGPAMTFAWPNTILPKVRNDPSIAKRIGLHQFARQALLGTQVLAIPEGPGRQREQIEAAKAILTLTTNSQMQFILADLGSIPVLNDLPHRIELRNRPFWKENYAKMVEAIRSSHPRPRTPRWREFSTTIGRAAPQTPILRCSRTDAVHLVNRFPASRSNPNESGEIRRGGDSPRSGGIPDCRTAGLHLREMVAKPPQDRQHGLAAGEIDELVGSSRWLNNSSLPSPSLRM